MSTQKSYLYRISYLISAKLLFIFNASINCIIALFLRNSNQKNNIRLNNLILLEYDRSKLIYESKKYCLKNYHVLAISLIQKIHNFNDINLLTINRWNTVPINVSNLRNFKANINLIRFFVNEIFSLSYIKYFFCRNFSVHIYITLLKRYKIKAVIGQMPSFNLIKACAQLGIPIYDLQHGVISTHHPYYFPRNENYKTIFRKNLNFIFTSREALIQFKKKSFLYRRNLNTFYLKIKKSNKQKKVKNDRKSYKYNFLYTLQPSPKDLIHKRYLASLKSCNNQIHTVFRLHPIQTYGIQKYWVIFKIKLILKLINYSNYTINYSDNLDNLLQNISIHLTQHSTVISDAFIYGVHSIYFSDQLNNVRKNAFLDVRKKGYLHYSRGLLLNQISDILKW